MTQTIRELLDSEPSIDDGLESLITQLPNDLRGNGLVHTSESFEAGSALPTGMPQVLDFLLCTSVNES